MENFKFILGSMIVLALVGLGGFWAFTTIQSGGEYVNTQKIKDLTKENEDLKKEVAELKSDLGVFQAKIEEVATVESEPEAPVTAVTTYKNQVLIDELQKLIDDKIFMKLKSSGARVGTVQRFLNIYNKTSNRVDNDYGASTKTAVAAFQKVQGLTADGEAGPSTFVKMIDWLKKQG